MTIFNIFQTLVGFLGLIAIAIPFSENRKIINYKYLFYGILAQLILALIFIKLPFITIFFEFLAQAVTVLQDGTEKGAKFLFGYPGFDTGDSPTLLSLLLLEFCHTLLSCHAYRLYFGIGESCLL